MKPPRTPRYEPRRGRELEAELLARARAWIPSWDLEDGRQDFGRALLGIAARFGGEVAQRLDRAGEKLGLGLLDWLAVRGQAARPARLPVVFQLTGSARTPKPAPAATRLQVEADGASVILETETDMLILPRGLQAVVAADHGADAFYVAPPGLSYLGPLEPMPAQWQMKSFAAAGAATVQLDPPLGLAPEAVLAIGGRQYRIERVEQDIVTLDPPLARDAPERSAVARVTAFMPFDGAADDRQEHALYIGHRELFDITAGASIALTGTGPLPPLTWHYWGKRDPAGPAAWQPLTPADGPALADGIVLAKPPGSMELLELAKGASSRWIRATAAALQPGQAPLGVDAFGIRVNCAGESAFPCDADPSLAPAAQGMANTTPLVLGNVFYPLGKEPRQFDAFYLGSQEAFSKRGATVQLQFKMAQLNFVSLSTLRAGTLAQAFVAGIPADGQLHLFDFAPADRQLTRRAGRGPLRPPTPAAYDAPLPRDNQSIALDPGPPFRLPVWNEASDAAIGVTAGGAVWIWYERGPGRGAGGWRPAGVVDPAADPRQKIEGLVYLADGLAGQPAQAGQLLALRGGTLFVHELQRPEREWQAVELAWQDAALPLTRIAPVCRENVDPGNGTFADGLVGVSTDGQLFGIGLERKTNGAMRASCTLLLAGIATKVAPVAVRDRKDCLVAVAASDDAAQRLKAFLSTPGTFERADDNSAELAPQPVIGGQFDMGLPDGVPTVVAAAGAGPGATAVVSWQPFGADGTASLLAVPIPATLGEAAGAPTLVAGHVLVPTTANQVIVAPFDLARHVGQRAVLSTAIVVTDGVEHLAVGDRLALPVKGAGGTTKYRLQQVAAPLLVRDGKALHEFPLNAVEAPLFVYRGSAPVRSAGFDPALPDQIALAAADPAPAGGSILLVTTNASTQLYGVADFDAATSIATLDRKLDVTDPAPATVTYVTPQRCDALVRPMLRIDPAAAGALPDPLWLVFPGAEPERQAASAYAMAAGAPSIAVLGAHWQHKPPVVAGTVRFIVDRDTERWLPQLGATYANPELSWEYWNGKGWWQLDQTVDGTVSLQRSGVVQFDVPADIGPTDWAGQTNYWIRARLIGGDYGREQVSVETTVDGGKSRQVVLRATEGIHPPSVAQLCIGYRMHQDVPPQFVLARDSGSVRDQSDANRSAAARVEAFVPLAQLLGRLSGAPVPAAAAGSGAPLCCDGAIAGDVAEAPTDAAPGAAPPRALYLGFDAPLLGEPVNLLLLVEERDHDRHAPLSVAVLVADRFVPVVVSDATRALGESGVLALALPVEATPRELFGRTLSWLRLAPAPGAPAADWRPSILAAALNGVWARAAETVTHELIGSSQGEPGLTLYLARPPVLQGTLVLRVKEPLGAEEIEALQDGDAGQVETALATFPGSWVLWRQVSDPGDAGPDARVYALDEASGEIRFGDGRHGRIPPVGRDAIMAVTYRRTEAGRPGSTIVPANAIAARTPLNLVSPIDGVEAVHAADQAAGGAPAQPVEAVARHGGAALRHRERALTARDVEDLALAGFPDIVQARCFPRQGFVQLVVVLRGSDPVPAAARRRELRQALLPLASPLLGPRKALRIDGPTLRPLRVDLQLGVDRLDDAGAVGQAARSALAALFDPATGGVEGSGWPLGVAPAEADVAYALADVPRLASILTIGLHALDADGAEQPWPAALGRAELPWLARDGIRIAFEQVGVNA